MSKTLVDIFRGQPIDNIEEKYYELWAYSKRLEGNRDYLRKKLNKYEKGIK